MNFNKLTGTVATLMLFSTAVFAADAHHDDHAPAPATEAQAGAVKEAPPKNGPGKDMAPKDAAAQSADEPVKPTLAKKSRKPARAKPQHKAPTHGTQTDAHGSKDASSADANANNSADANPSPGQGIKRLRVKERSMTANAAVNPVAANSPIAPDTKAVQDAPDAAAANAAHDAHDTHDTQDASAKPVDNASTVAPAVKRGLNTPAALAPKKGLVANDSADSDHDDVAPAAAHQEDHADHVTVDTHADRHIESAKSTTPEPSSGYCNPPLKSEVAALFERWNASLRTGDPKKVAANYAPGSVLLPTVSNRPRFTTAEKEDYFAHFLERRPEGTIDDRVIDVDCNSATDSGLYTFRFSDGATVKARYSFAYRKIGSQWLITSHHSSGMPESTQVAAEQHATAMPSPSPNQKPAERVEQGSPARGWVRYP